MELCKKIGVDFIDNPDFFKIGVSINLKEQNLFPINGLRHNPEKDTTGWYIWAGEYSEDPNFFVPIHVLHINEWNPLILKFLGLPPGYRFLIGENNYEDIWYDENLIF